MDLICILISPVGQVDRAALMAGLGYANARYEGEEAGEEIFTLEPTKFGIAQIGDCLVLIAFDIVSISFEGAELHGSLRALFSAFPEAEIGSFYLLTNDNSWGYSIFSKGEILSRKFGDSNHGTTIDEGISPPEIESLMKQSYTDDDGKRFFKLDEYPGRILTEDFLGQQFVDAVSGRFLPGGIFGNPAWDGARFDIYDVVGNWASPSPVSPPPANPMPPVTSAPPVTSSPPVTSAPPVARGLDLTELRDGVNRMKDEVAKVIVGQEKVIELLIVALLADGHVLIEGVPGVAKTLSAKLLARTFSIGFSRIQFTPDLMPSDVLGTSIFNQKTADFEFRRGPIFSNIILIDEINRAPAKTQSALFECMEERQVTIDGKTYPLAPPFIVLATQNPVEHEGTYRLPEAQLDRFLFKVSIDYPSLHEEEAIIRGHHTRQFTDPVSMITPVMTAERIAAFRAKVRDIHVEEKLITYIARLVNDTRQNKSLFLGASPRASIAILNASKAMAAIRGRAFITPDDIREVTLPVLQHRIILTPEREMEGLKPADVIKEIIAKIEVPR